MSEKLHTSKSTKIAMDWEREDKLYIDIYAYAVFALRAVNGIKQCLLDQR